MKTITTILIILTLLLILSGTVYPQFQEDEFDKCRYSSKYAKSYLQILGDHWGYSYDSLLVDLDEWSASPYISIDSLGASVQNRALWQLTITSDDTLELEKQTVFLHARTHPGEVQSWWVTEQVISQLTSESEFSQLLREKCVFYIVPMYNPDGVELEYSRENANGIDIESNWDAITVQPEVAILRARFTELMASDEPIQVAMNMHSAYGTDRFFVYHSSIGTSNEYAVLEQNYIEWVRSYYIKGIQPWNFRITWTTGTPTYYPESWFWLNHQEDVMALTYEDWNSDLATNFDSTANALLHGIADYLDVKPTSVEETAQIISAFNLYQNYPNPFNTRTIINYELPITNNVDLTIYNQVGQKVATLVSGQQEAGFHQVEWDARNFSSGVYYYRIRTGNFQDIKRMVLIR
jgi:hypothetical protein